MKSKYMSLLASAAFAGLFYATSTATAQPSLGSAASFGVLGASTVTSTGLTIISGDLGVSPGTSITGFPPGILSGTIHAGDAVAAEAHADAAVAYGALAGLTPNVNLTGMVLGDLGTVATLTPGVYSFNTSAQLDGKLILDAQNNPNALFVFQMGTTITTASNASVVVINNRQKPCDGSIVFWQVGSSATLGTGTQFVGNMLAYASITLTTDVAIDGRAIALNGAVTMDTNSVAVCNGGNDAAPPPPPVKVKCSGRIPVPCPNSDNPTAKGPGRATFSCHAHSEKSGGEKGECDYINEVTGLHIHGPVNDIEVIATDSRGEPKTVRLSGTCSGPGTFSVTVEDGSESGGDDEFGITVVTAAGLVECRAQRVISEGQVKFKEPK